MNDKKYLPFQVILSAKKGNKYSFIVNGGDINSFILNTYKANYLNFEINKNPLDKKNYYAFNSLDQITYELGTSFLKTFETSESCDVYLTIPKVPAGFYVDSVLGKVNWWLTDKNYHSDFLNQFSIITSTDDKFQEYYDNNILYVQQKDDFENLGGAQILKDSEYAGKIYIKIASIDIKGSQVKITPFLRSNVLSPHRYLRLGDLTARNVKIYFRSVAKTKGLAIDKKNPLYATVNFKAGYLEAITIPAEKDDPFTEWDDSYPSYTVSAPYSFSRKVSSNYNLTDSDGYFSSPLFINKSIQEIESLAKNEIQKRINYLNSTYYFESLFSSGKTLEYLRKVNLEVYQVVLIYKETLGEKIIVKNIYENIQAYNGIAKDIGKDKKKRMTETEAYESILRVDSDKLGGIEKIVNLQGFAKST